MKNSIYNLKTQLTNRQMLTNSQLFAIKGGDGEDKRRDDDPNKSCNGGSNGGTTTITTDSTTVVVKPRGH